MSTPHKWADVIKAMADGVPVQFSCYIGDDWTDYKNEIHADPFKSRDSVAWRIKPKDKEMYFELAFLSAHARFEHHKEGEELKLVFDGETGKFKSAEVVK